MWWTAISSKTKLRVGRLVKAHGLKGAIKLELYTDSPDQRFKPGQVLELQVPETLETCLLNSHSSHFVATLPHVNRFGGS